MDIYRIITLAAAVGGLWFVQVIGLSTFRTEHKDGPPALNVVDFEHDLSDEEAQRPIADLAEEKGWDISAGFVTADEAERQLSAYNRKKWIALLIGSVAAIGTFFASQALWGSWLLSLGCVITGPVAIAYGAHRAYRNC